MKANVRGKGVSQDNTHGKRPASGLLIHRDSAVNRVGHQHLRPHDCVLGRLRHVLRKLISTISVPARPAMSICSGDVCRSSLSS